VPLVSNLINCCFRQDLDLPSGPWAEVVLNYTGQADGGVYDSSYRMYVDQVPVLFGTTPEYGTWTVEQDLTEYSALLAGVTNLTFLLGAATTGGHFVTNLSLTFYPVPAGSDPPMEPTQFIPLWYSHTVNSSAPSESERVTVPSDAVNATLELWAYGFGPDEFWYTELPSYRAITVASDGTALATEYPFPFVNTGGIDLFLWRPVTAVATLDDRPQVFDLTGALPLLEGTHNLSANVTGVTSGSDWMVDGALVLYTDSKVTGATLQSYSALSNSTPERTVGSTTTESANASYVARSEIEGADGDILVSSVVRESFSSNISTTSGGQWENISQHARSVGSTELSGPDGAEYLNHTFDAPFSVDLGSSFVETRSTGGGYPIYGNFSSSFLVGHQLWNETFSTVGPGPRNSSSSTVEDALAGANGTYAGQEELTGPNAGLILGVSSISTYSPRSFQATNSLDGSAGGYFHEVVASGVDPSGPGNASPVILNSARTSLGAVVTASVSPVEVNTSTTLRVYAPGGLGALTVGWSGLPSGCLPANAVVLPCTPTVPGTTMVNVTVRDSAGDSASASLGPLVVQPAPSVTVLPTYSAIDLGSTVGFNATVTGGRAPYSCLWWSGGALAAPAGPCNRTFSETPGSLGVFEVNVTVIDSAGVAGHSAHVGVQVVPPVSVTISSANGSSSQLTVAPGSTVTLAAQISGGVGPYELTWYVNDLFAGTGAEVNVTIRSSGAMESVYALVNDSGGGSNQSGTVTVEGAATGGASSSGSNSLDTGTLALLLLGVGALAVVLVVVLLWPRPKRPTSRPSSSNPSAGAPPSASSPPPPRGTRDVKNP
jgi:hypothetical protein